MEKFLDLKNVVILVLGVLLIVSFFFGQKSNVVDHKDEITQLNKENTLLEFKNDSLRKLNDKITLQVAALEGQIQADKKAISDIQSQIDKLKNRKNETSSTVNHLSSNGVSDALSKYIASRSKN